jgi:hypothetical protein
VLECISNVGASFLHTTRTKKMGILETRMGILEFLEFRI